MLALLAFMSWMGWRHQAMGGGPNGSPSVDSLCPFGGLESLKTVLFSGQFLRRISPSSLVLFMAVVLMTIWGGRLFCGWLCPLGTLNELFGKLGRKLGIRPLTLPAAVDRPLRWVKYVVLAAVLAGTWKTGNLVFRGYDPWMSWMHLSAGWGELGAGAVVLAVSLFLSLFVERFWCRFLCPLGAALALLSRLSPLSLRRSAGSCINCGKCSRCCPMGLSPQSVDKVSHAECIRCGECADHCPVPGTLNFGFGRGANGGVRHPIPALKAAVVGIVIFAAVVGGTFAAGRWSTFAPQKAAQGGADFYGWMTVPQAAEAIGLTPKQFLKAAGLPAETALDVPVKKLPGVSDEDLKVKIAAWKKAKAEQAK